MYPLFPMKRMGCSLLHAQTPDQLQPPPCCSTLFQVSAVASLLGPSPGCCCRLAAQPSSRLLPSPLCSALRQAAAVTAAASLPDAPQGCCSSPASLFSPLPGGCYPPLCFDDAARGVRPCFHRNTGWVVFVTFPRMLARMVCPSGPAEVDPHLVFN